MSEQSPSLDELRREVEQLRGQLAECNRALGEAQQCAAEAQEQVARLDGVLTAMHDPVVIYDAAGVLVRANPAAVSAYGANPVGTVRATALSRLRVTDIDGRPVPFDQLPSARALRGEEAAGELYRYTHADGHARAVLISATPLLADGEVTGAVAVWHDVTERVRTEDALRESEEALRESEERYRQLVELSPEGVAVVCQAKWSFVNSAGVELMGADTPEQLVGRSVFDFIPPAEADMVRGHLRELIEEGKPIALMEQGLVRLDGTLIPVEMAAAPVAFMGERAVLVLIRDITARKRVEEALRRSEDRYKTLAEAAQDYIFIIGRDDTVQYVNRYGAEQFGCQPQDLIGRRRADIFPAEVAAGQARSLARVRETGQPIRQESKMPFPAVGDVWLHTSLVPLRDASGSVYAVLGISRDITALKRTEDALREANAAKDIFINVLSHELRGPLAPILAGVSVLRRALPDDERARRTLDIMERNTKLQARLVNDLLDLSRIARGKVQFNCVPVALDGIAQAALDDQRDDAEKAGLTLHVEAAPGVWVLGDFDRLQQVALNLVSNAVKFTPAGGDVWVRVVEHDGRGRLVVEDTGIGIDPELLSSIFEMFQQAKGGGPRKPGLGIGLALVRGIVEAHGGRVWAESEGIGKGSRFTVELPLVPPPHRAVPPAPRSEEEARTIRVLMVEDNPDALTVLADSLGLMGYEMRTAANAEDALVILAREKPDIIVSDIGLPGMDGYQFLRRAREMPGVADIPALALTGWGQDEDVRRAHEAGYAAHLVKPVDMGTLDECIRDSIGAAHPEGA